MREQAGGQLGDQRVCRLVADQGLQHDRVGAAVGVQQQLPGVAIGDREVGGARLLDRTVGDRHGRDHVAGVVGQLLGVRPETVLNQITMMRCGNGANIELFDYTAPDQDRTFRKNSDWGAKHLAFYVRDMNSAVAYMQAKGVYKLAGPLTVTDGPAAGQTINYFRTPFGTYVELISYPKGMAYEASADIPLWDPRDNRPGPRSGGH